MNMKQFFLVIATFVNCALMADWHPRAHAGVDPSYMELLEEPGYQELKGKVISSVANSWCTEQKIHLLMDLVLLRKPEICVEIGVYAGSSIYPVAATMKYLNQGVVYAIDAWSNDEAIKNLDQNDPDMTWWARTNMLQARRKFERLLNREGLNPYCVLVHSTSEAASTYIDNIDFLHLDGNYSEQGAILDVELYVPKVKQGGYILLSNLLSIGKKFKTKAFYALFNDCELITDLDGYNAVLFKKK